MVENEAPVEPTDSAATPAPDASAAPAPAAPAAPPAEAATPVKGNGKAESRVESKAAVGPVPVDAADAEATTRVLGEQRALAMRLGAVTSEYEAAKLDLLQQMRETAARYQHLLNLLRDRYKLDPSRVWAYDPRDQTFRPGAKSA